MKNEFEKSAIKILSDLVRTIEATGGLIEEENGSMSPAGDEEWIDLADVAWWSHLLLKNHGIDVPLTVRKRAGEA